MLAPLVAQQQGTTTHRRCLTVAGVEVYGYAPLDSWALEEAGYGQVSSLSFTLEDTASALSPRLGDPVVLWDTTADVPEFAGWVLQLDYAQHAPGRDITVRCAGAEALLDWGQVPQRTFTVPVSTTVQMDILIQSLVASCVWPAQSPIRALAGSGVPAGNQAAPLRSSWYMPEGTYTTPAGSLRAAITSLWTQMAGAWGASSTPVDYLGPLYLSVDFWYGLRAWSQNGPGVPLTPDDFPALTLTQDLTGTPAEGLAHTLDGGSSTRGVYVTGGTAAGTGFVTLAPVMGPATSVSDSTVTTLAGMSLRAKGVSDGSSQYRGSVTLRDASRVVVAGSMLTIGAGATAAAGSYRVGTISKRFLPSGRSDQTIQYGATAPSYVYAKGRP